MADETDFDAALKKLQVRLIDAANGYDEAVVLTESERMKQIFGALSSEHRKDAEAISAMLLARGQTPDEDGSWFTFVQEAIMNVRSMITGLREDTLQPIADGERRLESLYDDAIAAAGSTDGELSTLREQRARVQAKAGELEAAGARA